MKLKGTPFTALLLLALALGASALAAGGFRAMWADDLFVPAPGFQKHLLSEWFGGIGNAAAQCEALGITAYATPDEEPAGAAAGAGRSA